MSFQPVVLGQGAAAWAALKKSQPRQMESLAKDAEIRRDEAYFRENIRSVKTAEELVADPRLLKVALWSFGLEGDMPNKAFIRKVLESRTLSKDSLAVKLADKQYLKLATAFGFGDFSTPRSQLSDFPDKMLTQYRARRFEAAVGAQNDAMRLALNLERELPALLARKDLNDATLVYSVLGSAPLRRVFETALSLPLGMRNQSLDRQGAEIQKRLASQFGSESLTLFRDPAQLQGLVRRFLAMSEFGGSASPGASAVTLLTGGRLFGRI